MTTSSRSASWLAATPPSVAIEISSRRLTVVGLSGTGAAVVGQAAEPLPDGLVLPALTGVNLPQPEAVADALRRALDRAGLRSTRRAALIVPDSVARLTLLTLEQVPSRAADLDQLIRLQIRKATPFPLDDAVLSAFEASRSGASATMGVLAARRDVIAQYEGVAAACGIHAGLVDLASLSVMNAAMASGAAPAGDWLLVHLAAEAASVAILRGQQLLFHRHRATVDQEPLGALVHQTAMYHEDRLGGGPFVRVWICGAGANTEAATREIAERLGLAAEAFDVRTAVELRENITWSPDAMDALAAPIGVLLRDRKAA